MFGLWPTLKQYKSWSMPSKLSFISFLVGIGSLFFTVATYFISTDILTMLTTDPKRPVLWGTWSVNHKNSNYKNKLTIREDTPNYFRFNLFAFSGVNFGVISGIAKKNNSFEAEFFEDEYHCRLSFKIAKNEILQVDINENYECSNFSGKNVYFSGKYLKSQEHLMENKVFNEVNVISFHSTVGDYYDDFNELMQLVDKEDNLDAFDAKVHRGFVRGAASWKGGIIMQNKEGKIWTALLNDDVIRYFTNDKNFKKKIPVTIRQWSKQFDTNIKIVFMESTYK